MNQYDNQMNVSLLSADLNSNYARGYTNPLFSVRQVVIVCVCVDDSSLPICPELNLFIRMMISFL